VNVSATLLTTEQHQRVVDESSQKLVRYLVNTIARSARRDVSADLMQCGEIGLRAASMKYDEEPPGVRFQSYAVPFIVYAILGGLRSEKREQVGRAMLSAKLGHFLRGVQFLAEESDKFSVIMDSKETNHHRYQTLSDQLIAAKYLALGAAPLDPLEALIEAQERHLAHEVVRAMRAKANDEKSQILNMRYQGGGTLASIAALRDAPKINVRRKHKALLDDVRALLAEHEITELPELGPGRTQEEEDWPATNEEED
jgi:RNA polymerase sigma factor (sigma-70 family)